MTNEKFTKKGIEKMEKLTEKETVEKGKYEKENIETIISSAIASMESAYNKIKATESYLNLFEAMKFGNIGENPITNEDYSLLEQINQVFTILMSCYAATEYNYFPNANSFDFAFAENDGRDLVVYDNKKGKIAEAEIFATVSAKNNGKLRKEVNKLLGLPGKNHDYYYVFYTAPEHYNLKPSTKHDNGSNGEGVEINGNQTVVSRGENKVIVQYLPKEKFIGWINART